MKSHDKGDVVYDEPGTVPGWWLTPGPALCSCCEQLNQAEALYHCSVCDTQICTVCMVYVWGSGPRCPLCRYEPGAK